MKGGESGSPFVTVKTDGPDQTLVFAGLLGLGSILLGVHAVVEGDEHWLKTGGAVALGASATYAYQTQARERERRRAIQDNYNDQVRARALAAAGGEPATYVDIIRAYERAELVNGVGRQRTRKRRS